MRSSKLRWLLFVVPITLILIVVRFPYMVDVPVWNFLGRERIDPATLHLQGEFVESNLGSAEQPDGSVLVRMIAQQYVFVPQCVVVPVDVLVRVRLVSADAAHALTVAGTSYAVKVVPGSVTEREFRFAQAGEYAMPCHEFCGAGHYAMRARLKVVSRDQFRELRPDERVNCDAH
jgi:cytochrome c oxidase subunit 2